jgi:hypothetical protein
MRKTSANAEVFPFVAALTDERCNYNGIIQFVTFRKLKG